MQGPPLAPVWGPSAPPPGARFLGGGLSRPPAPRPGRQGREGAPGHLRQGRRSEAPSTSLPLCRAGRAAGTGPGCSACRLSGRRGPGRTPLGPGFLISETERNATGRGWGDTWGSMSRENLTPHGSEMRAKAARPQGPAGDAHPGHHPRPCRAGQSPLLGHPRARPGACLGLSQKLPGSGQHGASGCQGRASQRRKGPGPAAGGHPPAPGGKPPAPVSTPAKRMARGRPPAARGRPPAARGRRLGCGPPRPWGTPLPGGLGLSRREPPSPTCALRDVGRTDGPPRSAPAPAPAGSSQAEDRAGRPTGDLAL